MLFVALGSPNNTLKIKQMARVLTIDFTHWYSGAQIGTRRKWHLLALH